MRDLEKCCPPSTSTTRLRSLQTKSRMYRPSGTCLRKPSLLKRCALKAYQSLRSAGVISRRNDLARRFLASDMAALGMAQPSGEDGYGERREAVMLEPAE